MKLASRLWAMVAVTCAATGALMCLVLVHPGTWLLMTVLAGATAVATHPALVDASRHLGVPAPSRSAAVAVAVVGSLAVLGWGAVSVSVAVSLALLHLATASLLLTIGRPASDGPPSGAKRGPGSGHDGQQPARLGHGFGPARDVSAILAPVVARWSDERLCHAWQSSHDRLRSDDVQVLTAVAWERQLYLDEIERRHPRGFSRWMGASPRAASSPRRFLPTPPTDDRRRGAMPW